MSDNYIRGRERLALLRDLAAGDLNQVQLGEKYGKHHGTISSFAQRHAETIQKLREKLIQELDAFWIANRTECIAEIQDVAERAETIDPKAARIKLDAVKLAQEMLGQMPTRVTVTPVQAEVTYKVEDGDISDVV